MTRRDSISVIIPCFKQAHFLADSIASVLTQTLPADEIIVVDDGSPDNPKVVCEKYSSVVYHRQSNRGVAHARNTGMSLARGRYVIFLDADDRLTARALESLLACFHAFPDAGFVCGRHQIIDQHGSRQDIETCRQKSEILYSDMLEKNTIACPASVMFRREVVQELGGFDQSIWSAADYDLYLRVCRKWKAYGISETVVEYRRHATNVSSALGRQLNQVVAVLERQRAGVENCPELSQAICAGVAYYRDFYGNRLYWEAVQKARSGKVLAGLRDFMCLGTVAPQVLLTNLASSVKRVFHRETS